MTGGALFPETIVFVAMAAGNLYVIRRLFPAVGHSPTLGDVTFGLGLLLMAMGLWFALIFAAIDPGDASEISVFIALNSMMAVVGCWLIALFLRAETMRPSAESWKWPLTFAALFLGNELLMGIGYRLIDVGAGGYQAQGWLGLAEVVGDGANSVWFFGAMFVNMLALVLWVPLERPLRLPLAAFALTAALGPLLTGAPVLGAVGMAVLMALTALVTLRERARAPLTVAYLRGVFLVWFAFALMGAGVAGFLLLPGSAWAPFALAAFTLGAMALDVTVLAAWGLRRSPERPATGDPSQADPAKSARPVA